MISEVISVAHYLLFLLLLLFLVLLILLVKSILSLLVLVIILIVAALNVVVIHVSSCYCHVSFSTAMFC